MPATKALPLSLRLPRSRWPIADRVEAAGRSRETRRPQAFREFIPTANPRFQFYDHTLPLIAALQRVADYVGGDHADGVRRLMVFEPPRHGKSELVSRLFPAYLLRRYPAKFFGLASYAAELAYTFSRNARDNYRRAGGALKDDAAAVKHWETGAGGGLWAAGVGGPITGKGGHCLSIDDPLKNAEDAASATIRDKQWDWYGSTWLTRAEPGAAEVLTLTRWHDDDLAGRIIAQAAETGDVWHVLVLPAVETDDLPAFPDHFVRLAGPERAPGEALCPERYNAEALAGIERRLGPYYWGALYQQNPTPREGTLFQASRLGLVPALPWQPPGSALPSCRGWDLGATEGAGDYTAGVRVTGPDADGVFYVDPLRFRHEPAERNRLIRQRAEMDGPSVRQRVPQDPGAAGKESAQTLVRLLAGFPVTAAPVSGSKELRAEPLAAQVNAGNVRVVTHDTPGGRAAAAAFVEEARQFPNGAHDDMIDAAADAFAQVARSPSSADFTVYHGR